MDSIREHVVALANINMEVFRNTPIETFLPPGSDAGGLMRFPIAFSGKNREELLRLALKRGLYMKVLWSQPLPEESEYSRFPNAVWAARNLVLLPLYTELSANAAELLALNVVDVKRSMPEQQISNHDAVRKRHFQICTASAPCIRCFAGFSIRKLAASERQVELDAPAAQSNPKRLTEKRI
jgi:hypothetical protein